MNLNVVLLVFAQLCVCGFGYNAHLLQSNGTLVSSNCTQYARNITLYPPPSNASLFGPMGKPQEDHVVLHPLSYSNDISINGMLISLVNAAPSIISSAIIPARGRGSLQYDVRLTHLGRPVWVEVEARFSKTEYGSLQESFQDNACGLEVGTRAFWPALMKQGMERLFDIFSGHYFDRELLEQYENFLEPKYCKDFNAPTYVILHKLLSVMSPYPVLEVRPELFRTSTADLVQSINKKNSVGILILLDLPPVINSDNNYLEFSSGIDCFLWTYNDIPVANCTTKNGNEIEIFSMNGYVIKNASDDYVTVAASRVAGEADNANGLGSHLTPPVEQTIMIPISLVRDLNATFYLTQLVPTPNAKSPVQAPSPVTPPSIMSISVPSVYPLPAPGSMTSTSAPSVSPSLAPLTPTPAPSASSGGIRITLLRPSVLLVGLLSFWL